MYIGHSYRLTEYAEARRELKEYLPMKGFFSISLRAFFIVIYRGIKQ